MPRQDFPKKFDRLTGRFQKITAVRDPGNDYDAANKKYIDEQIVTVAQVPTGSIITYGAAAAPTGWLLCKGTAVSRTTYATLFGIIGVIYGVGDGSTTFNLPDLQDNVAVGQSGTKVIGTTGGAATVNLQHSHTVTNHTHAGPSHTHGVALEAPGTNAESTHTHAFSDTSSTPSASVDRTKAADLFATPANDHTHTVSGTTGAGSAHAHTVNNHSHGGATGAGGTGASGGATPGMNSQLSTTQSVQNPYLTLAYIIKT